MHHAGTAELPASSVVGLASCDVHAQDRAQAVEAQLAETTAELSQLKEKQLQLEIKNTLLEKVSRINKQQHSSKVWWGLSMQSASKPINCSAPSSLLAIKTKTVPCTLCL